jgi:hypothetical protein
MAEEEACKHCGAPRVTGYAACKFCKTPFVTNTQTNAIPCPRCNILNEMGAQRCVQCQAWVIVQCVFCHALSPHNVPACQHCGEAFAGAPQRFAERQKQESLQKGLQIAGTVGNVAASFLGAAAGAGLFSSQEHYHGPDAPWGGHHHHHREGEWVEQSSSGGGFFDSLFGGSSDSSSSDDGSGGDDFGSSDDSNDDS